MIHASGRAGRARLRYRQMSVEVSCPAEADVAWLQEFLAPGFATDAHASEVGYAVEAVVDSSWHAALTASRPGGALVDAVSFVLDQRTLTASCWNDSSHGPVCHDPAHNVFYMPRAEPRGVRIVAAAAGRLFRGAVMRVVRELAMSTAWTEASAVVHGAAFADTCGAILVAGPKHSGKTSLLVHCLHTPSTQFISNDRVVLSDAGLEVTAGGMPSLVSLRRGTLDLFPDLARTIVSRRYQAHLSLAETGTAPPDYSWPEEGSTVSPAQLSDALSVVMTASAPLSAVLLPRVDLSRHGFQLLPLSPDQAAGRVDAVMFAAGSRVRASEIFHLESARTPDLSDAIALWARVVGRVPVFEVVLGRGVFDPSADEHFMTALDRARDSVERTPA